MSRATREFVTPPRRSLSGGATPYRSGVAHHRSLPPPTMRLPVPLLIIILTLIAHAMIRLMPNLATLDSRIHSAFAYELGEAERIHARKPQPVPTKMLGQLMKTLSASLANVSSLSRSVQNASDMQKQLLRSLGSGQLVDGRGDYPHYRTSEAVRPELLPQEEALGAGLGRLDSSLSELERLAASTRTVSREVSQLRRANPNSNPNPNPNSNPRPGPDPNPNPNPNPNYLTPTR